MMQVVYIFCLCVSADQSGATTLKHVLKGVVTETSRGPRWSYATGSSCQLDS